MNFHPPVILVEDVTPGDGHSRTYGRSDDPSAESLTSSNGVGLGDGMLADGFQHQVAMLTGNVPGIEQIGVLRIEVQPNVVITVGF